MDLKNIGRYEIKSELGRGGMATVYHAYDPSFDREVAIKVLPREFLHNPQFLERFQREVKTIAQLEHPAIVPVYDVGEHDGLPYFVMRYMPGGSLSDMIKKGKFNIEDTARIVERLAGALSYAHRKGIIHRDLKPDNILFSEEAYPFISDFGIAKFAQSQTGGLTGSGIIGTPDYMSPEQATGSELDHRSDIYGLGVIVYQMLTGEQPYKSDTPMGVAIKHVTDPVPNILLVDKDLPEELGEVMTTTLAKDPKDRYPSAVEFARALNQVALGHPGNIQESSPTIHLINRAVPVNNRKYLIGGAVGIIVLFAIIFGGRSLFSGTEQATETVATQTEIVDVTEVIPTESEVSFASACSLPAGDALLSRVVATNKFCTDRRPYIIYMIPKGTTYEVSNPDFKCTPSGERDGNDLMVCTGTPAFAFDVKLCNPDILLPDLAENSDRCEAGAGYDVANQCCVADPVEAACVIFRAETIGC